jgi:SWI/SNF-related matrix-associated actin-dependent regulator of chromatin subfamily A3
MDPVRNETARITTCKHIFCQTCIEAVIANQAKCPMCRNDLPSVETTLVSPAKQTPEVDETDSLENMGESSSKLDALLHILDGTPPSQKKKKKPQPQMTTNIATRTKDPSVKTIVFSQFTKFLDIIQLHLGKRGFKFVRLDGSMTPSKRDIALTTFSESPTHTIMLASLAVCSVGVPSLPY